MNMNEFNCSNLQYESFKIADAYIEILVFGIGQYWKYINFAVFFLNLMKLKSNRI